MRLKSMADFDEITSIQAMPREMISDPEEWQCVQLQNSCKICQTFLRIQCLKNQYRAKLILLQEESDQAIRSLTTTFDEAKSNFDTLLTEKLDNYQNIHSYKPFIELNNQHSRLLIENANLQLKIKHLNRLLEATSNERSKEKSFLQNVIEKQEKTIEILNDNIYYFVKKLKFKKNSHSVIKRVHFKRKIRSILSNNVRNIKLLTEKLESYDKNNVNCHFYIKNKQCEKDEPLNAEVKSSAYICDNAVFAKNFFNLESESLISPTFKGDQHQGLECNHEIILRQVIDIDDRICSEYEESFNTNLNTDAENCSETEMSCHCDNYEICDLDEKLRSPSEAADFNRNLQTLATSSKSGQNNRTKYSIICRQTDITNDNFYGQLRPSNLSDGDAGNLSPKEVPTHLMMSKSYSPIFRNTNDEVNFCTCEIPKHTDEASFCACNNHLSPLVKRDYLDEEYNSSKTSVSDRNSSENSGSESSSCSEEIEPIKIPEQINQTRTQIHSKPNLSIRSLTNKILMREDGTDQAERPVRSERKFCKLNEKTSLAAKSSSEKHVPLHVAEVRSVDLTRQQSTLQFEVQDISQLLSLDIPMGEQHTVLRAFEPSERKEEDCDKKPYDFIRKLRSKSQHLRSLHHKVRDPSLWLPTVDEAADSENETLKNSQHNFMKSLENSLHSSGEKKVNSFYQIPDRPDQQIPVPEFNPHAIEADIRQRSKSPFVFEEKSDGGFDDENEIKSLLAFDRLETYPGHCEWSGEALNFGDFPLRTESAPGRLQTSFDDLVL